jgi:hypothetical protein
VGVGDTWSGVCCDGGVDLGLVRCDRRILLLVPDEALLVPLVPDALPLLSVWLPGFIWSLLVVLPVVLPGAGVVVGEVGSVGLPADGVVGLVGGTVESPAVGGTGGPDGVSVGGTVALGAVEVPGEVGAVEGLVDGLVEGDVELPVEGAGAVEGVPCCAIAAVANIAEIASDASQIDLREILFMESLAWGKFPRS